MMRLIGCAAVGLFLTVGSGATQSLDDRAMTLMTEAQLAAAAPNASNRRDRLVEAAWQARRIIEDAPDSDTAIRLTGPGFEIFGADPIRNDSLQDAMMDACVVAPSALCLVDMAYVLWARWLAPNVAAGLADLAAGRATSDQFAPGTYGFRADSAIAYAELGLDDRVRATFRYHVANDGRLTINDRAAESYDFAYALARIGDIEDARSIAPDILSSLDETVNKFVVEAFLNPVESHIAVGALAGGDRATFEGLLDDMGLPSAIETIEEMHQWSGDPALLNAAAGVFEDCLASPGPFVRRKCSQPMAMAYAWAGQVDEAVEAHEAAGASNDAAWLFEHFIDGGHLDAAQVFFENYVPNGEENIAQMARLGALSGADLIIQAEELALSEDDPSIRMTKMRDIALAYASVGNEAEFMRLMGLSNEDIPADVLSKIALRSHVYGLGYQSRFSEASAALQGLEDAHEIALWLAKRAVREDLR